MKFHILILGDLSAVFDFLDFDKYRYSLITSEIEAKGLASYQRLLLANLQAITTPAEFDINCYENQIEAVLEIAKKIHFDESIDFVLATYEHTVLPAAQIRSYFNLAGTKEETAILIRDKVAMKERLIKRGNLKVPCFQSGRDSSISNFVEFSSKFEKVVIKPISQAGSKGVEIFSNPNDVENALKNVPLDNLEIEEFIAGPIYKFDGLIQNGNLQFLSVCLQIGDCYSYVKGHSNLGSVIVDDKRIIKEASKFASQLIRDLDYRNGICHIEAFLADSKFILLEIAGRIPGGNSIPLALKSFGVNLTQESVSLECNVDLSLSSAGSLDQKSNPITGCLLIRSPVKPEIKITKVYGLDRLPDNIKGTEIPSIGAINSFPEWNVFKSLATFYFEDDCTEGIIDSIKKTENIFRVDYDVPAS